MVSTRESLLHLMLRSDLLTPARTVKRDNLRL
jgi:hypothetical protein